MRLFSSAAATVALLVGGVTSADAGPRTPEPERLRIGGEVFSAVGASDALTLDRSDDSTGEWLAGGATLEALIGPVVLGITADGQSRLWGPVEGHRGLLVGGQTPPLWYLGSWAAVRAQVLVELGLHSFENLGDAYLIATPVGDPGAAETMYAGARGVLRVESRWGFYFGASLLMRHDLDTSSVAVRVHHPFCFLCDEEERNRSDTWHYRVGGNQGALLLSFGWIL